MPAMQMPAAGAVINSRYRLDAILGDGGFGTVFLAMDLDARVHVALKVLHPDDGEGYLPATKRRFEREVAVLRQLRSEHTVQLLASGSTPEGDFYLVFEHLPGRDLSEVIHEGVLTPPEVEHVLRQLLASLSADRGITILMVSHEPDMVTYCDAVVHFLDGKVTGREEQTR